MVSLRYGEVMDINMPRDKETGKTRGFAFVMYEDQRSTVLAVDNLNGAKVLEKTLRVDHVKDYKQPKTKNADGEMEEPEEQSMNARPEMIMGAVQIYNHTAMRTSFLIFGFWYNQVTPRPTLRNRRVRT